MYNTALNILHGYMAGLLISIPLGPAGLSSIQRNLSKGKWSGIISGFGTSTSDTLFAGLALLCLSFVQTFITNNTTLILIAGGIVVAALGIYTVINNPIKQIRKNKLSKHYIGDFFSGFLMSFSNPGCVLMIIGVFTLVGLRREDLTGGAFNIVLVLAGVNIGANTWWVGMNTLLNRFRKKIRLRQLLIINRISGIIIAGIGAASLLKGLYQLVRSLFG